jgi:hypothetical protein
MRPPKKHGIRPHSPRERERPRSSCLAAVVRGRSRPSRRHQSRTSLAQQSQSTGRRRRRGAADDVCSKDPALRPLRSDSRAFSARAAAKAAANTVFLCPCGPGGARGVGAGWTLPGSSCAPLGRNWRLRLLGGPCFARLLRRCRPPAIVDLHPRPHTRSWCSAQALGCTAILVGRLLLRRGLIASVVTLVGAAEADPPLPKERAEHGFAILPLLIRRERAW